VSIGLGYVHAFTVLASSCKVALSLTHHELGSSGLREIDEYKIQMMRMFAQNLCKSEVWAE
jgi:hypothetical protein